MSTQPFQIWTANEEVPGLEVEVRDVASYLIKSVEIGGHAIRSIYDTHNFKILNKAGIDAGKSEVLTKADLVLQLHAGILIRLVYPTISDIKPFNDWIFASISSVACNYFLFHLLLITILMFDFLKVFTEEKAEYLTDDEANKYRLGKYENWINLQKILNKFPSRRISTNRLSIWIGSLFLCFAISNCAA